MVLLCFLSTLKQNKMPYFSRFPGILKEIETCCIFLSLRDNLRLTLNQMGIFIKFCVFMDTPKLTKYFPLRFIFLDKYKDLY